jgi:hypothetical protein
MSEATSNVEFAHRIHEQGHRDAGPSGARAEWVEILEAVLLALVAFATAWSGYQASRWGAQSAENYARASRTTVQSQEKMTLAGQDRIYDIVTFNGWVTSKLAGREKLTAFYERRFRPEYELAFQAWMKLDPVNNPSAPQGPIFMPEYKNANAAEALQLADQAKVFFEKGVSTRDTGDDYVKVTVFLATVLLLTALSQRFRVLGPRVAVAAVAVILICISAYWLLILPRA